MINKQLTSAISLNKLLAALALTLTFCCATPSFAQNSHKTDSLWAAYNTSQADSSRAKQLIIISEQLRKGNSDSALIVLDMAKRIITSNIESYSGLTGWWDYIKHKTKHEYDLAQYQKLLARALRTNGLILRVKGFTPAARDYYYKSLILYKQLKDTLNMAICHLDIGTTHYYEESIDSSNIAYQKAYRYALEKGDKQVQLRAINNLGLNQWYSSNYDSALTLYSQSHTMALETGNKELIAQSSNTLGALYYSVGRLNEAFDSYTVAVDLFKQLGDNRSLAMALSNIGLIYQNQRLNQAAIEIYIDALKEFETLDDQRGIAATSSNIGEIFILEEDFTKALAYAQKSYQIELSLDNKKGQAASLLNMGTCYSHLGRRGDAMEAFGKSLDLYTQLNDKHGIALVNTSLGTLFTQVKEYKKGIEAYVIALNYSKINGNNNLHIQSVLGLAELYLQSKELKKGLQHATQGLTLAKKQRDLHAEEKALELLSKLHYASGKTKLAWEYQNRYIQIHNQILSQQQQESINRLEALYRFDKQSRELESLKQQTLNQSAEIENQQLLIEHKSVRAKATRVVTALISLIAILAIGFTIRARMLNHRLKMHMVEINQKSEEITAQRDEIEAQRHEIETQRDNIMVQKEKIEKMFKQQTESIMYAKQIQNSLLPDKDALRTYLGDFFLLFKPKDIVSGDFYWTSPVGESIAFAVADCTGHGVPGAMLVMLSSSLIDEIIGNRIDIDPGKLLTEVRSYIIMSLWQRGTVGEQTGGLDAAFCIVDPKTLVLRFAGANQNLLIMRPTNDELGLAFMPIEVKGNKMSLAMSPRMADFDTITVQLQPGDRLYITTDGFTDQIGGPHYRKYSKRRFAEVIKNICHLPMDVQKSILQESLTDWQQDFQQVDDITVLGVRVWDKFNEP
ncbi:MAG: tetratricopeptide repeat protein [Bacteroidales bacterium]|nr:tetratricopeptide repeat protein [Bacteroidales bacterium]MBN2749343.1 tetratricopeptide repeat protein [Bacteroidales bacterium]